MRKKILTLSILTLAACYVSAIEIYIVKKDGAPIKAEYQAVDTAADAGEKGRARQGVEEDSRRRPHFDTDRPPCVN